MVQELGPVPTRFSADEALVQRLVKAQFPRWAHLPIRPVENEGWDNRTFHLGTDMSVRLPSAAEYALAVEKEHRWLPVFAPRLPLPISTPLARGLPGEGYPHTWSVYRWLDGETADRTSITDPLAFATAVAAFLIALRQIDPTDGPGPGKHNWFRGGSLTTYDAVTQDALQELQGRIDTDLALEVWRHALQSRWDGRPVWFHGDVAAGNLLMRDGALAAVIDFGTCGVGDPACDLAIAWTMLSGASRAEFRGLMAVDAPTWARGRGWALWKALSTYAGDSSAEARHLLDEILTDYSDGRQ